MIEASERYTDNSHEHKLKEYYHFHAKIYDATRWAFLFGRETILDIIPDLPPQPKILEIGCGTGHNIQHLQSKFPDAQILGVDLSQEMLNVAHNKLGNSDQIKLLKTNYGSGRIEEESFDLILLSYTLTMMSAQYHDILNQITNHLKPEGVVAVVDFHTSPFGWFRHWMNMNHVNLDGCLLPTLQKRLCPVKTRVNRAYTGLWSYFLFLGKSNRVYAKSESG